MRNDMPKIYALLDVDHTLIGDIKKGGANKQHDDENQLENNHLNMNLINALIKNNIKDVYLFTDMTFKKTSIAERSQLITYLQNHGIIVHGVLTTPDLFWGTDHEELLKLGRTMDQDARVNIRNNSVITPEQLTIMEAKCPDLVDAFRQRRHRAKSQLGAVYKELDTPMIQEKSIGAKLATDVVSLLIPGNPEPKALLFKHFIDLKPSDCTDCIIFDDKLKVLESSIDIAQNSDLNVLAVHVDKDVDFIEDPECVEKYSASIKKFLSPQNQVKAAVDPRVESIEPAQPSVNRPNTWLTVEALEKIISLYSTKRGFKLTGFTCDHSARLLDVLKYKLTNLSAKQSLIEDYLNNNLNTGRRLFDILVEVKVHNLRLTPASGQSNEQLLFAAREPSDANPIWLTKDMLYFIQQQYKQNRGFKLFGVSSSDTKVTLQLLSDKSPDLSAKQLLIDNYLQDLSNAGKRLYNVLYDLRSSVASNNRHLNLSKIAKKN